jgi:hypothetical protein
MKRLPLVLLFCASAAFAQSSNDYTLNDGDVRFSVPAEWSTMMEKSDGNPQAMVFKIPDPAAEGTEDTASITIKTRRLKSPADFPEAMQNELALSRAQSGYEADALTNDSGIHHYHVMRGKTRYAIRDKFVLRGDVAVQIRCQRPLLDGTSKDWTAVYENGCDRVVASLK